jgi:hypothetical protein
VTVMSVLRSRRPPITLDIIERVPAPDEVGQQTPAKLSLGSSPKAVGWGTIRALKSWHCLRQRARKSASRRRRCYQLWDMSGNELRLYSGEEK